MNILFLTQYFPPEVGAPQNRLFELAVRLRKSNVSIDVLTAMPNYPSMEIHPKYKGKIYTKEEMQGMTIYRSYIYVSKSKAIPYRLLNYFSFVFSSMFFGLLKLGRYDFILCESPPLFLGISSLFLAKTKRAKLIFNVSDLWPESAEKLGIISNKAMLNTAKKLEEHLYKKAVLVTGQTQGIVKDISGRFPNKNCYWLPNGVDLSFYNPDNYDLRWRRNNSIAEDEIVLAYAGILGHAQGLEVIIKAANLLRDNEKLKFFFLGSGPEKEKLMTLNAKLGNKNVFFLDLITKEEMPYFVSGIDISIIPLKDIPLFEGAIPSKIFENLSMKKPILLGLKGEARELFIDEGKAGRAFIPENEVSLKDEIIKMIADPTALKQYGENGRKYVEMKFNRNLIAEGFYRELKSIE